MLDRHLRFFQLEDHGLADFLDGAGHLLAAGLDLGGERFERARLERLEGQFLQLVLHLAHPEPVGDRGVDVERFLGDAVAALVGQMPDRAHVVERDPRASP